MTSLEFWCQPGKMTEIGPHAELVAELPMDPKGLRRLVSGLLLHPAWCSLYNVGVDETGESETQLRRADKIVDALLDRSSVGLAVARPAEQRAMGTCRNFSALLVALLRAKGIPARARAGHASYFEVGKWVDHWIIEWWNEIEGRWVRSDPQIDMVQQPFLIGDIDPDDLPPGAFLAGAECWQRVRSGDIDPQTCGIFDMWGAWFVRSNVVRDLAALNKVEMLPWDGWGLSLELGERDDEEGDLAFDEAAAIVIGDDLDELVRLYSDSRFRVPSTITSFLDSGPTSVDVDV